MAYTKYSLTPANNTAAPPDGAPEGMLPSAVNDTMRDMMAQIRDVGDGIRDGTYTMTAPKITGGSITGSTINNSAIGGTTAAAGTFTSLSDSGNLTFTGTGNRITGDFSTNSPITDQVFIQTSTTNGSTRFCAIPNGTGTTASFDVFNNSTPTNAARARVLVNSTDMRIDSAITGTGTYLPLTMFTGGSERLRIETDGDVSIGTSTQVGGVRFTVVGGGIQLSGGTTAQEGVRIQRASGVASFTGINNDNNAYNALSFATSATEAMRIDTSGNVGIGTSSPSTRLDVRQNTSADLQLQLYNNNAGIYATSIKLIADNATGSRYNGIQSYSGATAQWQISGGGSDSTIAFGTGSSLTERMRIASDGSVGIGITNPNSYGKLAVNGSVGIAAGNYAYFYNSGNTNYSAIACVDTTGMAFYTAATERMRITSAGGLLVGKTTAGSANAGMEYESAGGALVITRASDVPFIVNRLTNDGTLIRFLQDTVEEGSISVSGNTVSYNGGHLSRWSQLPSNQKDDSILKGTVMSNLDDMCVWTKDGEVLPNEQLNKMKVSDVEGDTNVAGVFVNWTRDEDCNSDDMNVAMTGDMIIRIADGVVVQKGDLLMSAGDGTAKPQGDDIVRSKTIAKVTSNHVTCTYADGSYCVPCVLMAC